MIPCKLIANSVNIYFLIPLHRGRGHDHNVASFSLNCRHCCCCCCCCCSLRLYRGQHGARLRVPVVGARLLGRDGIHLVLLKQNHGHPFCILQYIIVPTCTLVFRILSASSGWSMSTFSSLISSMVSSW